MKNFYLRAFFMLLLSVICACCAKANEIPKDGLKIGDTIFLGSYEQNCDLSDESSNFQPEPIEWIIIDIHGNRALLLSKYILDYIPYNKDDIDITWKDSSVRTFLNDSFYNNSFSSTEKSAIVEVSLDNYSSRNKEWSTNGGYRTIDHVFLLSYNDLKTKIKYLKNKTDLNTSATRYAEKKAAGISLTWWLRSPGQQQNEAAFVLKSGEVSCFPVNTGLIGLRPALWLDLSVDYMQSHSTLRQVPAENDLNVGDTFFFGCYEQDYDGKNESLLYTEEPIEWIVISKQDNKVLLLSKYVLDYLPYNKKKSDITWKNSDIRTFLNDDFLTEAFSLVEQDAIVQMPLNTIYKDRGGALEGKNTEDYIFLLSYQDVNSGIDYLKDRSKRTATATVYAKYRGANAFLTDNIVWWLRSSGKKQSEAASVRSDGQADYSVPVDSSEGVRPALWLDLSADFSQFNNVLYEKAKQAFVNGDYDNAVEYTWNVIASTEKYLLFYKDVFYYNLESDVRYLLHNGDLVADYEDYVYDEVFMNLTDKDVEKSDILYSEYKLVGGNITESCYVIAKECIDTGEYERAINLLNYIGVYKDSVSLLKDCYDVLGTKVYYFTVDPVNTGHDNGYSVENISKNNIDGKDRHYGWKLGQFFISGFTDVKDRDSDNPVFLKTINDSVTLSFDLKQDIDCLNGNKKLVLASDTNGYDLKFQTEKQNFGRGTLITRMTDYQNKQQEYQIYTDYLVATETTGAITNIVFNEEGDYEVALDYEIKEDQPFGKVSNYCIYFKFSVRNGNCMIFPRDAKTSSELKNSSIAENGFFLDLAQSHYLDINVTRSEIVMTSSGITEDIRFSKAAGDGERYTDEGIYTIKVKNEYTGENVMKTIFVGSQELLDEYIENGFSMDRLK